MNNDQKIFGSGKHWVYLYYFKKDKDEVFDRERSRNAALYKNDPEEMNNFEKYLESGYVSWPCKIGKTKERPEARIKAQTSGVPIPPEVALLIRTDQHTELERFIHRTLKLNDQHRNDLQGNEWFDTNPKQVSNIYEFIRNPLDWNGESDINRDHRVVGSGKKWIYLYYFLSDLPMIDEGDEGWTTELWPCRIGMADKNPKEKIKRITSGVRVPPKVALFIKTDYPTRLMDAIYSILKLRSEHRASSQAEGWFNTSPEEVENIHDFVVREEYDWHW